MVEKKIHFFLTILSISILLIRARSFHLRRKNGIFIFLSICDKNSEVKFPSNQLMIH